MHIIVNDAALLSVAPQNVIALTDRHGNEIETIVKRLRIKRKVREKKNVWTARWTVLGKVHEAE